MRASAGAHFRLTLYPGRPVSEVVPWLERWHQRVLADGRSRSSIYELDWLPPTVLILSNEAHGAAEWLDELPVLRAAIPMAAETESLNVAAAAAVILYEAGRQVLFASRR